MAKKRSEVEKTKKDETQKIVTKYDRKMERRRLEEEKEQKTKQKIRFGCIAAGICVVAAALTVAGYTGYQWYNTLNNTFFKAGEHEIKGIEYEYYYQSAVNNYLSMYGAYLPYMGLDTSKDFSKQDYNETLTWKEYFDQMAVDQLKEVKALSDDASAQGFTFDEAAEYADFKTQFAEQAKNTSVSAEEYYKINYGRYATEERVEPYVKENLLAASYYQKLLEENKPDEQAVTAYYNENKKNYDTIDYRSFSFGADLVEGASEEEISSAMGELQTKAEEMKKRRESGEDFKALCLEYAKEDEKVSYEGEDKDASLTEGALYSAISSNYADWLYEEGRQEGDLTVVRDDVNHKYYIVEFVKRTYNETSKEKISNLLASQAVNQYIEEQKENYTVTDISGKLTYLKKEEATESESAETAQESEEESSLEETTKAE